MDGTTAARCTAEGFRLLGDNISDLHDKLRCAVKEWDVVIHDSREAELLLLTAKAAAEFANSSLPPLKELAKGLSSWSVDQNVPAWKRATCQLDTLLRNNPMFFAALEQIHSHLPPRPPLRFGPAPPPDAEAPQSPEAQYQYSGSHHCSISFASTALSTHLHSALEQMRDSYMKVTNGSRDLLNAPVLRSCTHGGDGPKSVPCTTSASSSRSSMFALEASEPVGPPPSASTNVAYSMLCLHSTEMIELRLVCTQFIQQCGMKVGSLQHYRRWAAEKQAELQQQQMVGERLALPTLPPRPVKKHSKGPGSLQRLVSAALAACGRLSQWKCLIPTGLALTTLGYLLMHLMHSQLPVHPPFPLQISTETQHSEVAADSSPVKVEPPNKDVLPEDHSAPIPDDCGLVDKPSLLELEPCHGATAPLAQYRHITHQAAAKLGEGFQSTSTAVDRQWQETCTALAHQWQNIQSAVMRRATLQDLSTTADQGVKKV